MDSEIKQMCQHKITTVMLDVFPNSRHGFQFPERDVYETHAAEESWSKVVTMWDRNLK
jgi:dienelactone hydrolase